MELTRKAFLSGYKRNFVLNALFVSGFDYNLNVNPGFLFIFSVFFFAKTPLGKGQKNGEKNRFGCLSHLPFFIPFSAASFSVCSNFSFSIFLKDLWQTMDSTNLLNTRTSNYIQPHKSQQKQHASIEPIHVRTWKSESK